MARIWTLHRFDEIDSTNRWLAEQAEAGVREGTVATALLQTAGRGRLGRSWLAPKGSALMMSVLVRPVWPVELWPLTTFAIAEAARHACGHPGIGIKWPNDLVVEAPGEPTRKLAGILAQAVPGPRPGVVVGIGINVARPAEGSLPEEIAAAGVWLNELLTESDPAKSDDAPLDALRERVLARFGELLDAGPGRIIEAARQSCVTLGRAVRVELPGAEIVGTAVELDDDGTLVVETPSGLRRVTAGDVVHLRTR